MNVTFNYHSSRARSARIAAIFTVPFQIFLVMFSLGCATGAVLLWGDLSLIASVLGAIAIWSLLPLVWFNLGLKKMQPSPPKDEIVVEDNVDPAIVAHLASETSTTAILKALNGTWQQRFFTLRYGVDSGFFTGLPDDVQSANKVWNTAHKLSELHGRKRISAAALLIGLIKITPESDKKLAELHLDIDELESSIDWLHHTDAVRRSLGSKPQFGGIGRDWTAGYTPRLNTLAHNMSLDIEHGGYIHRDFKVHSATVNEMLQFLSQPGRANVALVGETGSGKTTTAYAFAQRLLVDPHVPGNIRFHKVFMLDAARMIAQTSDGSKLEQIVLSMISEAAHARNIILFMDEAHLFFSQGTGSVDLSSVLLPLIENGNVPVVMSFTPSEWQELSAHNSHLSGLVNYLAVPETDEAGTLRVMEDATLLIEARHGVRFTYQALKETYRLAERYNREAVFPGRAILLMEAAVNHAENGIVSERSVQQSIEATRGVKVQTAGAEEKKQLLDLENQIHARMVNQSRAVKLVSDALRRARSGVNNPNKPIGTFLFLGPTGVGKTELAKSIAATYFSSEEQMVRVDMNEFTRAQDTARLLDADNPSGLIASISKQPFSVVLFDEIEKAHPDVVNIFLQLLDEGILRDAANKQVSFKDAVVIATSNAGADQIREAIEGGRQVEEFEKEFINKLIDSNIFKPEFLNRFDETVVFRPLTSDELLQVVNLLISSVNDTLRRQKVSVVLEDAAKKWLVEQGNDPRLGARPLRRMVQRTVENIVAKKVLDGSLSPGQSLTLTLDQLKAELAE